MFFLFNSVLFCVLRNERLKTWQKYGNLWIMRLAAIHVSLSSEKKKKNGRKPKNLLVRKSYGNGKRQKKPNVGALLKRNSNANSRRRKQLGRKMNGFENNGKWKRKLLKKKVKFFGII